MSHRNPPADQHSEVARLLADAPKRWGRWGPEDEVGALNYLDAEQVRRGLAAARHGRAFALGMPICDPEGDAVFLGRWPARHFVVADAAGFEAGRWQPLTGGMKFADDYVTGFAQAGTHCDALGHMWFGDELYNGYPAHSTNGGMSRAGISPIARRGIVGAGVLLDMARHRGKTSLDAGESFDHGDLLDCARAQGTEIEPRTILMIRTGWLDTLSPGQIVPGLWEPGLKYSRDLALWFDEMQIPCLVTDTLANETTFHTDQHLMLVLHAALMRNLGVVFVEMARLAGLAAVCAETGRYQGLFTAAPADIVLGTGGGTNPVFIL